MQTLSDINLENIFTKHTELAEQELQQKNKRSRKPKIKKKHHKPNKIMKKNFKITNKVCQFIDL